jgi:phosphatidylglycerophosphatase A
VSIKDRIYLLISTFFYLGYIPFIPGTFGSLAGILLFYLTQSNTISYLLLTLILTILGYLTTGETERVLDKKDARVIVIDEVCGMLISLMLIPLDIKLVSICFLLFRLLDILKPYPAGRLQNLKGSIGIMGDDIVAGLYTNITLQVVLRGL